MGFKFYGSLQTRTCISKKQGFYNYGSDGQCMQKIKEGESSCEMYLDLVDDFINDEECHFSVQISLLGEDLDVVEPQLVTLDRPSTRQISEKQMNEICRIKKR